jgi:hypothetical protein
MAQRIDMEHRGWTIVVRRGRRGFVGLANRAGRKPLITIEWHGRGSMLKALNEIGTQIDIEETLAEARKGDA